MSNSSNTEASSVRYPTKWGKALVLALPIVGLVLGWLADKYVWPAVMAWLSEQDKISPAGAPLRHAILLASLFGGMVVPAFAITSYFWLMSFRIFRFQSFPPRGYLITSITPVIHGSLAHRKGVELLLYGVLAISMTVWVIWSVFNIFPEIALILEPLFIQLGLDI